MFGKINEIQGKMEEAKAQLSSIEVTASSFNGNVKVVASADKQIRSIEIIEGVGNKEGLEQDILQAVNEALKTAETVAQDKIKEVTSGILPNIPGLDLFK